MSVPYKSTPHGLIAQESNDFWLVTFARFFTDSTSTMRLDKFLNSILISKPLQNVQKVKPNKPILEGRDRMDRKSKRAMPSRVDMVRTIHDYLPTP